MKILIIEDEPAILLGLKELFEEEKFDVLTYEDGDHGYLNVLAVNPSAVILDINLPNMNGFEICRKLREKKYRNPIIMLTARTDQLDKIVGLEIGASDYITKPFNPRELLARVRAQIRLKSEDTYFSDTQEKSSEKRKLLSVMFTDMKDYSKKMNMDEEMGIRILKTHNEILNNIIKQNDGNVIETIGDSYLVSFSSAINSVICAKELQKKLEKYNNDKSSAELIEIRIGIHLGDVINFEGKLKGDTINIAARIQEQTPAGKTYISESVFNLIKESRKISTKYIGKKKFKNIKNEITLYEIV